jgi:hypothetical protein
MLAFQSALRGKLIRHTFDVDSIRSKRGLETTHQHLKLWSDFSGYNYTVSFYVKTENTPGAHLEFPVECFEPQPSLNLDDPKSVRVYFRLQTISPKPKQSAQGKGSNTSSPGMVTNLQQRPSFLNRQHNTSVNTLSQPFKKIFSKNRKPSESSNQRCKRNTNLFHDENLLTKSSDFKFRIRGLAADNTHSYRVNRVRIPSGRPDFTS